MQTSLCLSFLKTSRQAGSFLCFILKCLKTNKNHTQVSNLWSLPYGEFLILRHILKEMVEMQSPLLFYCLLLAGLRPVCHSPLWNRILWLHATPQEHILPGHTLLVGCLLDNPGCWPALWCEKSSWYSRNSGDDQEGTLNSDQWYCSDQWQLCPFPRAVSGSFSFRICSEGHSQPHLKSSVADPQVTTETPAAITWPSSRVHPVFLSTMSGSNSDHVHPRGS